MTNLTRFNPFREMLRQPSFGQLDEFFENLDSPVWRAGESAPRIRMDVVEKDNSYEVRADIPGTRKEDIRVTIDGNMVTISAEVKNEHETRDGERVVRSERYYGRASRSFALDREVDEEKASARYDHGVLELSLPVRAGSAKPRSISVQ